MFFVKIYPKEEGSSLFVLQGYVSKIVPEQFILQPEAKTIQGNHWATCSYKVETKIGQNVYKLVRKYYFLIHKDSLIVVELTGHERDFRDDEKLIDTAIETMRFSDNYVDLVV